MDVYAAGVQHRDPDGDSVGVPVTNDQALGKNVLVVLS